MDEKESGKWLFLSFTQSYHIPSEVDSICHFEERLNAIGLERGKI